MAILRPVFRVGQVYALALRESRVIPNALMQEHVDGPARGARFRSANPFFRDLLMTLDRLCRYSLSLAFCTENAALALRTPPRMPHCHAGEGIAPWLAPPAVKVMFSTIP